MATSNSTAILGVTFSSNHSDSTTQLAKTTTMTQSFYLYNIPDGTAARISLALNCILTPGFGIIGVLGNILNIIILPQHGFKESSNIILVSLSISDLVFSILQCLSKSYFAVILYDYVSALTMNTLFYVYFIYVQQVVLCMGVLHVTLISVERFVAVWFPFKASRIFSPRNVLVVVIILYLINIIFFFPCNFIYSYRWIKYKNGSFFASFVYLPLYYNDLFQSYSFYLNNLINIPLFSLVVLTILIVLKLTKARHKMRRLTQTAPDSMKTRSKKVFRLLLTICIVAIVVYIPSTILENYMWLTPEGKAQTLNFKDVLVAVENLLYQIGASINFFVYVTMSSKYVNTYRKCFRLRKKADKK